MSKQLSPFGIWYRSVRKSLIIAFGGKCWNCGKKLNRTNAEFAHTKPTGLDGRSRGGWNRLHDVMKNPTYYALLCPYCHRDYDSSKTC